MFKKATKIIALLTLILILAYAVSLCLPHTHECVDADCLVCAMMEGSRKLLIGLVLTATLDPIIKVAYGTVCGLSLILSIRDGTPVGQKVKLSN